MAAPVLVVATVHGLAGTPPPGPEVDHIRREVTALQAGLELAAMDDFHLLLDPGRGRLRLMHGGALLANYEVLNIEVGTPRRLFRYQAPPGDWCGRVWSGGGLWPLRAPAVSPPPDVDLETWIPPTPDEAFPLPSRYSLRFQGGLNLEVVARGAAPQAVSTTWTQRLRDAAALLFARSGDVVRVRITLARDDAEALHRGFPHGSRLQILPPPVR